MKLWKQLIGLFFLLVIVDGALRKWVLPSQATALFVLKDIVLWGGVLLYALRRNPFELPRPLRSTWVSILLIAYLFVVLLQAFNLRQPNLIVGAIGLKAHLAYVPLVVLLPALIIEASQQHVVRFLWWYALLLYIPIVVLGVYQFFQPPTAWINQYVREMATIATVQGHPRITGTFSYIGSFTPFLQFNAFLGAGIALAGIQGEDRNLKILGSIILVATAVILPMTGSRGPVIMVIGGLFILLLIGGFEGRLVRPLAVGLFAVFFVTEFFGGSYLLQGWEMLAERTQEVGADEAEGRLISLLTAPITGLDDAGLVGYGVGTNHQAASRFVGAADWAGRLRVDNGVLRIMMELGFLGWLVFTALKIALLHVSFRSVRQSQNAVELIISATAFCTLLSNIIAPLAFNVVNSAIYWGIAGAVLGTWSMQWARRSKHRSRLRSIA
jgi:hypothetical protein